MQKAKELLRNVKNVEIKTKHLVDTLISGSYHSVFKGNGIEFSEIREYFPGDDIRAIDWNVTARFNKPFVKEFIEERDLRVYFAVDFSASLSFGNIVEKKQKAIEIIATLGFSAVKNNDNTGLFLFTDKIEKFIPARKGKKHMLEIISSLFNFNAKSKTTLFSNALREISKIVKKRSIIFIMSDFFGLSEENYKELLLLKKRHDVVAIRIADQRELNMPDIGLIQLEDYETGEQLIINTSDKEFREKYNKSVEKHINMVNEIFKKANIGFIDITTEEQIVAPLRRFFRAKARR